MRRSVTNDELTQMFTNFKRTVFRGEQQPAYAVGEEAGSLKMFLDGIDHDPLALPYFRDGFALFAEVTASGREMSRVRVHDTPLTDYQRWLRWLDQWNTSAGEQIDYLDRSVAIDAGLSPAVGFGHDFWLFDDRLVLTMQFGADNALVAMELTDDSADVAAAIEWRGLARRLLIAGTPETV